MANNSVDLAYKSPYMWRMTRAFGLDPAMTTPELWDALMQVVVSFDAPLYVRTIPAGATTYGGQTLYAASQEESDRIYLRFNTPCIMLGVFFIVRGSQFPLPFGTVLPTNDDILVSVDYNRQQDYFVARQSQNSSQTGSIPFATLTSQDIRNRMYMQLMPDIDGEVGFTFTTLYASSTGSNVGTDLIIHVDVIAKDLSDYNADRLLPQ